MGEFLPTSKGLTVVRTQFRLAAMALYCDARRGQWASKDRKAIKNTGNWLLGALRSPIASSVIESRRRLATEGDIGVDEGYMETYHFPESKTLDSSASWALVAGAYHQAYLMRRSSREVAMGRDYVSQIQAHIAEEQASRMELFAEDVFCAFVESTYQGMPVTVGSIHSVTYI